MPTQVTGGVRIVWPQRQSLLEGGFGSRQVPKRIQRTAQQLVRSVVLGIHLDRSPVWGNVIVWDNSLETPVNRNN